MNALSAVTNVGSLIQAAKDVLGNLKHGRPKPVEGAARPEPFGVQLTQAVANQKDAAITRLIQEKDADKNGVLSAAELGADTRVFTKLDANADGQVTKLELMAGVQPASTAKPGTFSILT